MFLFAPVCFSTAAGLLQQGDVSYGGLIKSYGVVHWARRARAWGAYLRVLLVSAVDLADALLGGLGGGGGGEGLLHPAGAVPQSALDAERLVQLIHLGAHTGTRTRTHTHTQ